MRLPPDALARRALFALVPALLLPAWALAQDGPAAMLQTLAVGGFEFPIPGTYVTRAAPGGMAYVWPDERRSYTLSAGQVLEAGAPAQRIARLETATRQSWEAAARQRQGRIVRPFLRLAPASGLTLFALAADTTVDGQAQSLVLFMATDGTRTASVQVEGFDGAVAVYDDSLPLAMRVRQR